jgi:hypothetical protein
MSILSEIGTIIGQRFREHKDLIDAKLESQTNQDIEITDFNKGIILNSPTGKKFRITINDNGELIKNEITDSPPT